MEFLDELECDQSECSELESDNQSDFLESEDDESESDTENINEFYQDILDSESHPFALPATILSMGSRQSPSNNVRSRPRSTTQLPLTSSTNRLPLRLQKKSSL